MSTKTRTTDAEALARIETADPDAPGVRTRTRAETADIRAAVAIRDAAQRMVDDAVTAARDERITWIEIGAALGISPQGARQRYAR